jgi:8-oxo-dGTP pyrophosphatase MutT (NUDIX family)
MKKQSHKIIQDLVATIKPLDHLEEQHIYFALQWIASDAEIFRLAKPATPDTHLVCYFVLLDSETNQILLTAHKKSGLWLPPGGHVEVDEHPLNTVKREAEEELSIEAEFIMDTPFFLTISRTVGASQHTDVSLWYLLKGNSSIQYNYAVEEFDQIRWFRPEEIPYSLSDRNMVRLINKLNKSLTLSSYESSAKEYATNTASLHPHLYAQKFMQMLQEDEQVIDIGCGPGRDAKVFQERGLKVTGIDFSPKMIAIATSSVPQAEFHVMDIEKLNFPENTFDGAWASASFFIFQKKTWRRYLTIFTVS